MSLIDHLDSLVQLHEEISIIYVVDGYRAELLTRDGDTIVQYGEGPTIEGAMIDLATKLALTTLDDVRGTAPVKTHIPDHATGADDVLRLFAESFVGNSYRSAAQVVRDANLLLEAHSINGWRVSHFDLKTKTLVIRPI